MRGIDPYTHGPSFANGPSGPKQSWEQRQLMAMQENIYKYLEPQPCYAF